MYIEGQGRQNTVTTFVSTIILFNMKQINALSFINCDAVTGTIFLSKADIYIYDVTLGIAHSARPSTSSSMFN